VVEVLDVVNEEHTGKEIGFCNVKEPALEKVLKLKYAGSKRTTAPLPTENKELSMLMRPPKTVPPRETVAQDKVVVPFQVPFRFWNTLSSVNVPPVAKLMHPPEIGVNVIGRGEINVPSAEKEATTIFPATGSKSSEPVLEMEMEDV